MPFASGVPTIRWDVVLNIRWPDGQSEVVGCGHQHYTADGAIRCAKKYDKIGLVWNAWACSAEGVYKIRFSRGLLTEAKTGVPDTSRVLTHEEFAAEWKTREAAEAVRETLS